eukprot:scaffold69829_cov69-Phaeocystis_antarctica.AAC.1
MATPTRSSSRSLPSNRRPCRSRSRQTASWCASAPPPHPGYIRLQPRVHTVAASITYGCSLDHVRLQVRVRPAAHTEYRWSAPLTITPLGDGRARAPARLRCKLSTDAASTAEAAAAAAARKAARTPDLAPAPLGGLGGGGGGGLDDEHAPWDPAWFLPPPPPQHSFGDCFRCCALLQRTDDHVGPSTAAPAAPAVP